MRVGNNSVASVATALSTRHLRVRGNHMSTATPAARLPSAAYTCGDGHGKWFSHVRNICEASRTTIASGRVSSPQMPMKT